MKWKIKAMFETTNQLHIKHLLKAPASNPSKDVDQHAVAVSAPVLRFFSMQALVAGWQMNVHPQQIWCFHPSYPSP
jgi:hypothetical protein